MKTNLGVMLLLRAVAIASLLAFTPVSAGPTDARIVVAQYGMYFPGDIRFPDLRLEIPAGGQLFLANADSVIGSHRITEELPLGSIDEPRFDSAQVDAGQATEVFGIAELDRGAYAFVCLTHGPVMRGTLHIV